MELTEAKKLAAGLVSPTGTEWVSLDQAVGRVSAQPAAAHCAVPGQPRSRLDGFALLSGDTLEATRQDPVVLKVLRGVLSAGHAHERWLRSGECLRILTGALLPHNADAVAPQEKVFRKGNRLILDHPVGSGSGVFAAGEEVRKGELLFDRGEILTPTRLAFVAALGHAMVPVHRRPRVALLATGDEVREIGELLEGPWTYCNNRHLLAWMTALRGGTPLHLGIAKDDPVAITERLRKVDADVIITTGGIGHGDRDFVLKAWRKLGVRTHFREINLSPGRHSALGSGKEQLFFGLPGNPWGAQVVFGELIAPLLSRYQGLEATDNDAIRARLGAAVRRKKGGVHKAVRGVLNMQSLPPTFFPAEGKSASLLSSLRNSTAYFLVDPQTLELNAGDEIRVRMHDLPLATSSFIMEPKEKLVC